MRLFQFSPYTKNGKEGSILCIAVGSSNPDDSAVINKHVAGLKQESGYFWGFITYKNIPGSDKPLRSITVAPGSETNYQGLMELQGFSMADAVKAAFANSNMQPQQHSQPQQQTQHTNTVADDDAPF